MIGRLEEGPPVPLGERALFRVGSNLSFSCWS